MTQTTLSQPLGGAKIVAVASALPSVVISSEEAEAVTGLSAEIRRNKLGIDEIRMALPEETPSVLGARAVESLLEKTKASRDSIEFLIFVTQNPDFKLPTTACLVQDKCGLPQTLMAFDINQGCSGFVVAMAQAYGLVRAGLVRRGIVVTCDAYSRIVSPADKDTYGLFGDAATATLIEACDPSEGFQRFGFGTDGSGAKHLILRNGGAAASTEVERDNHLYMNGRAIYSFVTQNLPPQLEDFLRRNDLPKSAVDQWYFHQANQFMNSRLCALLEIPESKAYFDIRKTGNTVSSSIPLVLEKSGGLEVGRAQTYVFCGFGVGLSWATCLYKHAPTKYISGQS